MKKRLIWIVVLGILGLAADQGSKIWARDTLKGQPSITLIQDYLYLEYHENPGSAFGLLRSVPGARYILIGVGLLALILVWSMIRKVEHRRTMGDIAFALVAGGAVGNLIDRIYIGRVVDFVVMHWQHSFIWPAYNVADALLVVGVALMILVLGRAPDGAKAPARPRSAKGKKKKAR